MKAKMITVIAALSLSGCGDFCLLPGDFGCGGGGNNISEIVESEPNDTEATADNLGGDTQVYFDGECEIAGTDYYVSHDVPVGPVAADMLSNTPELGLRLYHANGSFESSGPYASANVTTAGSVYIQILCLQTNGASVAYSGRFDR